jgi:hypothetical protein
MKLRIKGDSLRLRVSRSELARLLGGERVDDTIHFSPAPDARLTYGLQCGPQSAPIGIEWKPQNVTVRLSEERMRLWGSETEVGIYESVELGDFGSLEVIVEKDFACLDRSDAENADTFANPSAGTICE